MKLSGSSMKYMKRLSIKVRFVHVKHSHKHHSMTNLQSVPAELGGALFDDSKNLGNGEAAVDLMIQLRRKEVQNLYKMINAISTHNV